MKRIFKNSFPICFLSKSSLLFLKKGEFQIIDLTTGTFTKLVKFNTSFKEAILTRIPILARILRKGIRCGVKVSENLVLFVIGQKIYELDLDSKVISEGYMTSDKSRPLVFSKIECIKGFDDGIYFGGYKVNPGKKPISIYKRIQKDDWVEVFQFPQGSIEHIHNIIADPYKNTVYILTGDFDHSAGIWMAQNGFELVVPLLIDDQKYRGCVGFPTPEGLVYATDSPFDQNSIRLLKNKGNDWESIHLMDINGPSIYGCQWCNDFVFSTSVEDDGRNQDIWYKLFGKQRGISIKENYSFIYKGNVDVGFKEIYKAKKDCLPFYLFQYGVLIFPSGTNNSLSLPVFHMATQKNTMHTILLQTK